MFLSLKSPAVFLSSHAGLEDRKDVADTQRPLPWGSVVVTLLPPPFPQTMEAGQEMSAARCWLPVLHNAHRRGGGCRLSSLWSLPRWQMKKALLCDDCQQLSRGCGHGDWLPLLLRLTQLSNLSNLTTVSSLYDGDDVDDDVIVIIGKVCVEIISALCSRTSLSV